MFYSLIILPNTDGIDKVKYEMWFIVPGGVPLVIQMVKNLPAVQEIWVSLWVGKIPGE